MHTHTRDQSLAQRTYEFTYDQLLRIQDSIAHYTDCRICTIIHLLLDTPRPVHDIYVTVIQCDLQLHTVISLST